MKKYDQQIIDKVLSLYVSDDELRVKLQKPYRYGDFIVATDSRALIRIPVEHVEAEYPQGTIKSNHLLNDSNCHRMLTLSDIKAALAKVPRDEKTIDCDECEGTGGVIWEYTDQNGNEYQSNFDCPVCKGKGEFVLRGQTELRYNCRMGIGDVIFYAPYIGIMADTIELLGCSTITQVYEPCGSEVAAKFILNGDIHILLCRVGLVDTPYSVGEEVIHIPFSE